MHPDMTSVDMMMGKKPPQCASTCSGRKPQTATRATCGLILVLMVSFTMTCQTQKLELCVDILARVQRGELVAHPAYVGFEGTFAQLKRCFLREISCAKGTMSGDGLDQPQGGARMGGS